jgi:hypothetical protein
VLAHHARGALRARLVLQAVEATRRAGRLGGTGLGGTGLGGTGLGGTGLGGGWLGGHEMRAVTESCVSLATGHGLRPPRAQVTAV